MSIFNKIKTAVDNAYHHLLPKPASEYTKAGITALARLVKDLVIDGAATTWLVVKSFCSGIPASAKSMGSVIKACFWDLPKAAYYKYQKNEEQTKAALKQAYQEFNNASARFAEAISISADTAYQGIKPIMSDVASSIAYNGSEAILDAGAVASIGLIEGGKALNNYVLAPVGTQLNNQIITPVASQLAAVIGTLETMATQQASAAYNTLPSVSFLVGCYPSLLSGFNVAPLVQDNKPVLAKTGEVEMSVFNMLKTNAAAA